MTKLKERIQAFMRPGRPVPAPTPVGIEDATALALAAQAATGAQKVRVDPDTGHVSVVLPGEAGWTRWTPEG